jgi:hypothetical protein
VNILSYHHIYIQLSSFLEWPKIVTCGVNPCFLVYIVVHRVVSFFFVKVVSFTLYIQRMIEREISF